MILGNLSDLSKANPYVLQKTNVKHKEKVIVIYCLPYGLAYPVIPGTQYLWYRTYKSFRFESTNLLHLSLRRPTRKRVDNTLCPSMSKLSKWGHGFSWRYGRNFRIEIRSCTKSLICSVTVPFVCTWTIGNGPVVCGPNLVGSRTCLSTSWFTW